MIKQILLLISIALLASCTSSSTKNEANLTLVTSPTKVDAIFAEELVNYVNEARINVGLREKQKAISSINKAEEVLYTTKGLTEGTPKEKKIYSGKVKYVLDRNSSDMYVPIYSGKFIYEHVQKDIFPLNHENITVDDVELAYVKIIFDKKYIEAKLENAKRSIEKGDLIEAERYLRTMLNQIITVEASVEMPVEKTLANLAIVKELVRHNKHRESVKTFEEARLAFDNAKEFVDSNEFTKIKSDLAKIHNAIKSNFGTKKDYLMDIDLVVTSIIDAHINW